MVVENSCEVEGVTSGVEEVDEEDDDDDEMEEEEVKLADVDESL